MSLGGRVRLGIALHAAVNVGFAAVALAVADGAVAWTSTASPLGFVVRPAVASVAVPTELHPVGVPVVSTGYCLDGTTASGVVVGPGQAAMNGVALGTTVQVLDGPMAGSELVVTDRIGHSTELDIWFDDCDDARTYGRRSVRVALD